MANIWRGVSSELLICRASLLFRLKPSRVLYFTMKIARVVSPFSLFHFRKVAQMGLAECNFGENSTKMLRFRTKRLQINEKLVLGNDSAIFATDYRQTCCVETPKSGKFGRLEANWGKFSDFAVFWAVLGESGYVGAQIGEIMAFRPCVGRVAPSGRFGFGGEGGRAPCNCRHRGGLPTTMNECQYVLGLYSMQSQFETSTVDITNDFEKC